MLLSLVRGDRNTRPIVDEESDSTSRVLSETAYHGHGHLPAYAEMKVPFLAIGPRVKVGRRIRAVSIYDLAPTIAHVLGLDLPGMKGRVLPQPEGQHGRSMSPHCGLIEGIDERTTDTGSDSVSSSHLEDGRPRR